MSTQVGFYRTPDGIRQINKTAADRLDYTVDWTDFLGAAETIVSHDFTAPAGITKVGSAASGATTTVRLSGGTPEQVYSIKATVTLSDDQIVERTFRVRVYPDLS